MPTAKAKAAAKAAAKALAEKNSRRRLRHKLSRSTPRKCWQESREEYGRRLKRCCEEVNKECDVEGLCKGLPKRMKLLEDKGGDRLRK